MQYVVVLRMMAVVDGSERADIVREQMAEQILQQSSQLGVAHCEGDMLDIKSISGSVRSYPIPAGSPKPPYPDA